MNLNKRIRKILKETIKYKNPKFLYHGTFSKNIDNIKKNGLKVDCSIQHKFECGIYLASDFFVAANYMMMGEIGEDFFVIEIPFESLSTNHMKPDDYELFDLLYDDYLEYKDILDDIGIEQEEIYNNTKFIYNSLDYRDSLYICQQLLYTKNIKPNLFSRIYNKSDIKKKLNS